MTAETVRAAIQDLHQRKASLIRSTPIEWPLSELDRFDFPLILVKRGPGSWYREGTIIVQERLWQPMVYLVEKNPQTLGIAEDMAIDITQQLGEIYADPDNKELCQVGDPCQSAQIAQQQGDDGIIDTELGTLEYWGKEYYGVQFDLPVIEKGQN